MRMRGLIISASVFGLACVALVTIRSSFKPQHHVTKFPRLALQRSQELSGDTSPASRRLHKHSLDFPDARFQFTNCSTTNSFAISVCDKKNKPMIVEVFGMKAVKRDAGISTAQVIIERPNEANGIS